MNMGLGMPAGGGLAVQGAHHPIRPVAPSLYCQANCSRHI